MENQTRKCRIKRLIRPRSVDSGRADFDYSRTRVRIVLENVVLSFFKFCSFHSYQSGLNSRGLCVLDFQGSTRREKTSRHFPYAAKHFSLHTWDLTITGCHTLSCWHHPLTKITLPEQRSPQLSTLLKRLAGYLSWCLFFDVDNLRNGDQHLRERGMSSKAGRQTDTFRIRYFSGVPYWCKLLLGISNEYHVIRNTTAHTRKIAHGQFVRTVVVKIRAIYMPKLLK